MSHRFAVHAVSERHVPMGRSDSALAAPGTHPGTRGTRECPTARRDSLRLDSRSSPRSSTARCAGRPSWCRPARNRDCSPCRHRLKSKEPVTVVARQTLNSGVRHTDCLARSHHARRGGELLRGRRQWQPHSIGGSGRIMGNHQRWRRRRVVLRNEAQIVGARMRGQSPDLRHDEAVVSAHSNRRYGNRSAHRSPLHGKSFACQRYGRRWLSELAPGAVKCGSAT